MCQEAVGISSASIDAIAGQRDQAPRWRAFRARVGLADHPPSGWQRAPISLAIAIGIVLAPALSGVDVLMLIDVDPTTVVDAGQLMRKLAICADQPCWVRESQGVV